METSQELLHLKRELSNVSLLVQQCQKEQKLSREDILKNITAVKKNISMVQDKVQHVNDNLKDLSKDVSNIMTNVKKIFGELEKQANKPTP